MSDKVSVGQVINSQWEVMEIQRAKNSNLVYIVKHLPCGEIFKKKMYKIMNHKRCRGCMVKHRTASVKVGDEFFGWTVIEMGYWGSNQRVATCRHTCGAERKYDLWHLMSGNQKCRKCAAGVSKRKSHKEIILSTEFNKTISSAKRRGYDFSISKEEYESLVQKPCAYCGREPFRTVRIEKSKKQPWHIDDNILMNGIDRVDNDKGYVPGNVSPCCWVCNIAKGTMSLDEWAEMVKLWSESINGI